MILDRIFAAHSGDTTINDPNTWWGYEFGAGRQTRAGEPVTPDKAMALPAYYACINAIAPDLGKLPFITYERLENGGKDRALDHHLYSLLHDSPNDEMTAIAFRETITAHALGWTGGYAEIERNGAGFPIALWPIHPSRATPKRDQAGTLYYEVRVQDIPSFGIGAGLRTVRVEAADMLHIHGLGDNGISGFATSSIGREAIGIGLAQQTFRGSFFRNGSMPGAAIETANQMTIEAKRGFRTAWNEIFQGAPNSNRMAILDKGMVLKPYGIDPAKAQMIEAGYYTVEDIARLFRMPPHKIQHLLRATFSNITEQSLEYVTDTLQPWLVRWEQEIKRKLFTMPGDDRFFAEHLVDGLLRGDAKARAESNKIQLEMGTKSIDEVRSEENRNPLPDGLGAKHYISTNLKAIEDSDPEPTEPVPPPTTAPNDGEQEPEDDDANAKAATAALFEATFARILTKETNDMRRLAKRHAGDHTGFGNAVEKYYVRHKGLVSAESGAAASLAEKYTGRSVSREAVNSMADQHVARSARLIRSAFVANKIEPTLEYWDNERPAEAAVALCDIVFWSDK